MRHIESTFAGASQLPLYYQSWHPYETPVATIGLVHGLGSYSDPFEALAKTLVAHQIAVYAMELRGHGRSPGQRGYVNRWSELREDLECFQQLIQSQHPGQPFFLLGHSLGATVVLDAILHDVPGVAGAVLMSVALGAQTVPPLKLLVGRLLSKVWPRFSLDNGLPEEGSTRDPAVAASYATDPLRHRKGTARLATEFCQTSQWIKSHFQGLQIPLLILHGAEDIVTCTSGSQWLQQQSTQVPCEYHEYPGAYHDLHNDLCAPEVFSDITRWLTQQLGDRINNMTQLGQP